MPTHDPDISHKLVDITQPTETLLPLLQNTAMEIRPVQWSQLLGRRLEPMGQGESQGIA
jgi:hypothetical protein